MLRIGTAGWKYKDWDGIVYPKPKPRGFDELGLARWFEPAALGTMRSIYVSSVALNSFRNGGELLRHGR